ncbi:winged helix-turn-helix domain-containing protein [Cognatiluteimonas lumbrici]|uniref:winged helix-turn-helix domain-containing protein n=1 Tax=Cognatiluteimonas lumbrici TaxID=2559601 RepID=UPI00112D801D|nr:transcriptional regulator [Luteimonas lumbrici]
MSTTGYSAPTAPARSDRYRFEGFTLDTAERRLLRGDAPVELGGRYFDALALLVADAGRLVSKDRFLEEVWNGIPVTEEALTQCIRTLRRELGDSATNPRFIETVPKHGYRFIAPVVAGSAVDAPAPAPDAIRAAPAQGWGWQQSLLLAAAGTTGAGIAGLLGGLAYGFAGASQPLAPGMGAVSMLLVMVCLTIVAAVAGGAGVSAGIAASALLPGPRWRWSIAGGALGGMLVGVVVKLLGLDAFNLLLGRSPGDITGGAEGLLLGASVGFGLWFGARGGREPWRRRSIVAAAIAGAIAGVAVPLSGGRLMGGSLDLLAGSFEGSRLRLDRIGALFGEPGFGPVSQAATGAMEGALFGACIVGAMVALAPLVAGRASLPAE